MPEARQLPRAAEAARTGADDRDHGAGFYIPPAALPPPGATVRGLRAIALALPGAGLTALLWMAGLASYSVGRDSGAFAVVAMRMLAGAVPYRDLWDHKPPGVYMVDALAFLALGARPEALVALDLAIGAVLVVAAAWALLAYGGRAAAAVGVAWLALLYRLPGLYQGGNFTEVYAQLPILLALGSAARGLVGGGRRWFAAAGFCAGAAVLFKPVAGTTLAALVVVLGLRAGFDGQWRARLQDAGVAVLAATVPVLAAAVCLGLAGALPQLVDEVVVYNRYYSAGVPAPAFLGPAALLAVAAAIAAWQAASKRAPLLGFAALHVGFDAAGIAAEGRAYGHYFVLLAPSTAAVVTVAMTQLPAARGWRTAVAGAALFCLLAAGVAEFGPRAVTGSRQLRAGTQLAEPAAAAALASACPPPAPIYVWGAEPEYYFWSGRRPASRYFYLYPLQMPGYDDGARVQDLLADLRHDPPCAILDTSSQNRLIPPLDSAERAAWRPATDPRGYTYDEFGAVYSWIDGGYRSAGSVDGLRLYVRRG